MPNFILPPPSEKGDKVAVVGTSGVKQFPEVIDIGIEKIWGKGFDLEPAIYDLAMNDAEYLPY